MVRMKNAYTAAAPGAGGKHRRKKGLDGAGAAPRKIREIGW